MYAGEHVFRGERIGAIAGHDSECHPDPRHEFDQEPGETTGPGDASNDERESVERWYEKAFWGGRPERASSPGASDGGQSVWFRRAGGPAAGRGDPGVGRLAAQRSEQTHHGAPPRTRTSRITRAVVVNRYRTATGGAIGPNSHRAGVEPTI